jgi:protein subunit release factor A
MLDEENKRRKLQALRTEGKGQRTKDKEATKHNERKVSVCGITRPEDTRKCNYSADPWNQ